jgi:hypothetical protein
MDNTDEPTNSLLKKIDLSVAISGLTQEIERARKAKEAYKSSQQKAIKLLEKEYKARLEVGAFLKAIVLFKNKGNAVTFLTLNDREYKYFGVYATDHNILSQQPPIFEYMHL